MSGVKPRKWDYAPNKETEMSSFMHLISFLTALADHDEKMRIKTRHRFTALVHDLFHTSFDKPIIQLHS
jgi:hypothetical protein